MHWFTSTDSGPRLRHSEPDSNPDHNLFICHPSAGGASEISGLSELSAQHSFKVSLTSSDLADVFLIYVKLPLPQCRTIDSELFAIAIGFRLYSFLKKLESEVNAGVLDLCAAPTFGVQ